MWKGSKYFLIQYKLIKVMTPKEIALDVLSGNYRVISLNFINMKT